MPLVMGPVVKIALEPSFDAPQKTASPVPPSSSAALETAIVQALVAASVQGLVAERGAPISVLVAFVERASDVAPGPQEGEQETTVVPGGIAGAEISWPGAKAPLSVTRPGTVSEATPVRASPILVLVALAERVRVKTPGAVSSTLTIVAPAGMPPLESLIFCPGAKALPGSGLVLLTSSEPETTLPVPAAGPIRMPLPAGAARRRGAPGAPRGSRRGG